MPSYPPAYLGRGIVYRLQGSSAQALADFNKAIALRPDNAEAYYNRGLLYQSQRQHQFAIDDFSTAIGLSHAEGGAIRGARPELPRHQRQQGGGERSRRRRAARAEQPAGLDQPRPRLRAALNQKDKAAGSYAKALNINGNYAAGEDRLRARRRQVRADLSDVLSGGARRPPDVIQFTYLLIAT